MKALHRLKPANGGDTRFDLTTEYPRWRLAADRRANPDLAQTDPVTAEFSLSAADRTALGTAYGVTLPDGTVCFAARDYNDAHAVWLEVSVEAAAQAAAAAVALPDEELAKLTLDGALEDAVAAAKGLAKEHREAGETPRAKLLTSFANELAKYESLFDDELTDEQSDAIWKRIPRFFYFSNYDTLPGETNLTALAAKLGRVSLMALDECMSIGG